MNKVIMWHYNLKEELIPSRLKEKQPFSSSKGIMSLKGDLQVHTLFSGVNQVPPHPPTPGHFHSLVWGGIFCKIQVQLLSDSLKHFVT